MGTSSNAAATVILAALLATTPSCLMEPGPSEDDVGAAAYDLRICADGPTVNGIDVSHWDGMIDWPTVAASGVAFSFMKASQGTSYTDDTFARNWREARSAGVLRGAYHFFCPKMNGTTQADQFLSVMGAMQPDDLPPVLDVESCSTAVCGSACDWSGVSCATIATNIQRFVDRVASVTGRTPMIYTGVGSWDGAACGATDFAALPLWVANYGVTCPAVPAAWTEWTFWQTGDGGSVPGISTAVDMNVFNGNMAALRAFAGSTGPSCGDGRCDAGETCGSCAGDCGACPPSCGDGRCDPSETCGSCAGDCGACPPSCGDGRCDPGETCGSCAGDCGACPPSCGDGRCDPGETCGSCAGDCGACSPSCGDALCDASETCGSCAGDCGPCTGADAGVGVDPDDGGGFGGADGGGGSPIDPGHGGSLSGTCRCSATGPSGHLGALASAAGFFLLVLVRRRRRRS